MTTKEAIVEAACATLISHGIGRLTVALVAHEARVSSALVHYHFATKRALLVAATARLASERTARRVAALEAGGGVGALDALWANLQRGGAAATERAWLDLVLVAREDTPTRRLLVAQRERERSLLARSLPRVLAELGARPAPAPEELAATVCTFLDGAATALAAGTAPAEVRVAFDAFWLALVVPGSAAPR